MKNTMIKKVVNEKHKGQKKNNNLQSHVVTRLKTQVSKKVFCKKHKAQKNLLFFNSIEGKHMDEVSFFISTSWDFFDPIFISLVVLLCVFYLVNSICD